MRSGILIIFLLLSSIVQAQNSNQFLERQLVSGNDTLPYRILMPQNFDENKKYPVLFVLHGAGERGNDNQAQLTHGSKLFLKEDVREKFPAIIIFPQCPKDSYWSNVEVESVNGKREFMFQKRGKPTIAMKLVMSLVKEMKSKSYTDKERIYVGGLSMGGMGTFEVLRRLRNNFAAAFSICGGDNIENVKKYKKVPLWIFHGGKDDVVPPENSERVVSALKSLGAPVKYSLYPEANHNSWDQAFAEPDLLPWLFSHTK
ncbi:carboxylesterase family protein [Daejeonella oryzae]|uniref:carboxylesterase family protein n=1 Tax=Daejeonella oryzae TaxID=1122943 RepID=UPI00040A9EBE|nr:prolyl oligopeptidase family serine peptidase [Daejeonella oryzae]